MLPVPSALAQSAEPVALIDARPLGTPARATTRTKFAERISRVRGIELVKNAALGSALAGEQHYAETIATRAAVEAAARAFKSQNCKTALAASDAALLHIARLQALEQPAPNVAPLYVWRLICGDRVGNNTVAEHAARILYREATTPPPEITTALWQRYRPQLSIQAETKLAIQSKPNGATVWLDHKKQQHTPTTLPITVGLHIVAAGSTNGHAARWVQATQPGLPIALTLTQPEEEWRVLRKQVSSWAASEASPSATAVERVMSRANVRFAFVMVGKQVQVWAIDRRHQPARHLGTDDPRATLALGSLILSQLQRWSRTGPDPNRPLLVEDRTGNSKKPKSGPRWWVYASLVGAVALGAGIIVARDLASDRQRVEIVWPR